MGILILLVVSAFYGWRFSKTTIDPDWSMFNLAAFTGSWYGRDFADCKTPLVHLWFWAIAKVVGADIRRVKFAHHFLLGLASIGIYLLSGNFWAGLAFVVLVNSGWLLAFHGNVGQVPAALIALGLASGNKDVQLVLWVFALLYEPKLLPAFVVIAITGQWYMVAPIAAFGIMLFYMLYQTKVGKWIWESSVVIPARMAKYRTVPRMWVPWYMAQSFLYLMTWAAFAVMARPDALYWIPAGLFLLFTAAGKTIRPNHMIPLVAWIAMAGLGPLTVIALALVDWISTGFYFGENWYRFYHYLGELNDNAQAIGTYLRDKAGTLWVNGIHTGVYIHARKPVPFGLAEQIEINGVAIERRVEMKKRFEANPPDWVVDWNNPLVTFDSAGYRCINPNDSIKVWQKIVGG